MESETVPMPAVGSTAHYSSEQYVVKRLEKIEGELEKAYEEIAILKRVIQQKDENYEKLLNKHNQSKDQKYSETEIKEVKKSMKIEKKEDDILIISSDEDEDNSVEASPKLIRLSYGNCIIIRYMSMNGIEASLNY